MAIVEILKITHNANNNVKVVLKGALSVLIRSLTLSLTLIWTDGKETKDVAKEISRSSPPDFTLLSVHETQSLS